MKMDGPDLMKEIRNEWHKMERKGYIVCEVICPLCVK